MRTLLPTYGYQDPYARYQPSQYQPFGPGQAMTAAPIFDSYVSQEPFSFGAVPTYGYQNTSAYSSPGLSQNMNSFAPPSYQPGSYQPGSYQPGSYEPGNYTPGNYSPSSSQAPPPSQPPPGAPPQETFDEKFARIRQELDAERERIRQDQRMKQKQLLDTQYQRALDFIHGSHLV